MNLITQLTQRITPLVLPSSTLTQSAEPSLEHALLEQFYALVAVRLTEAPVQQRLLGGVAIEKSTGAESLNHSANSIEDDLSAEMLFAQLWPAATERQIIVDELADSYYMTAPQTEDLLHTALPLLYNELRHLSRQQRLSLTELLVPKLSDMRAYIAPWAAPLLASQAGQIGSQEGQLASEYLQGSTLAAPYPTEDSQIDALHASPADEHDDDRLQKTLKRSNKPALLIVTLLIGLLILAGLAWLAFNYYQQTQATDPVAPTAPVAPTVTAQPVAAALTPAKLALKMDLGQSLYECQATVGNAQLEEALFNTLTTVLGEQARACVITIDASTATEMTSLPSLAGILSVVQPIAFATLELQGNTLSLSAPDPNALNQMIMQIQSMAPALTIVALDPIAPAGETLNGMNGNDNGMGPDGAMPPNIDPNAMNNQIDMSANNPNMPSNNNYGYAGNEGAANTGGMPNYEQNMAAPNNNPGMNNNNNNAGPISPSELDELTNMTIVAEPAQGGRPIRPVE